MDRTRKEPNQKDYIQQKDDGVAMRKSKGSIEGERKLCEKMEEQRPFFRDILCEEL